MSCCDGSAATERIPGTGCCGSSCARGADGCASSEPRIRSCNCQRNTGCLTRADCGGFRPTGTAATGVCPGPCQCAEEEIWNSNAPPKPNCEWLSNFVELRRQWSDHGRQGICKCCNCRPCRTSAPCRPCLPPTSRSSTTVLPPSDCQERCNDRRLSGGAYDKPDEAGGEFRNYDELPPNREDFVSGAMYPSPSYGSLQGRPAAVRQDPGNGTDTSERYNRPDDGCQPCAPAPKPILKKRSCCQCPPSHCACQPMPRNCNCPPPVQVDARADRECSCDCPSSPECACPPSERRFARTTVKCPNARICCPLPRLPPGPKCRCTQCQPCLPPPCDPCTSSKCRGSVSEAKPCRPTSPCPPQSSCRPSSPVSLPLSLPVSSSNRRCSTPPCATCRKTPPASGDRAARDDPAFALQPRPRSAYRSSSPPCVVSGQSDSGTDSDSAGESATDRAAGTVRDRSLRDLEGTAVGTVRDGSLRDLEGSAAGTVRDGSLRDLEGSAAGTVRDGSLRDLEGSAAGTVRDGSLRDLEGSAAGTVRDGSLRDLEGSATGTVRDGSLRDLKETTARPVRDSSLRDLERTADARDSRDRERTIGDSFATIAEGDSPAGLSQRRRGSINGEDRRDSHGTDAAYADSVRKETSFERQVPHSEANSRIRQGSSIASDDNDAENYTTEECGINTASGPNVDENGVMCRNDKRRGSLARCDKMSSVSLEASVAVFTAAGAGHARISRLRSILRRNSSRNKNGDRRSTNE